jgi:predicted dienelactone hydrolase
VFLQSNETRQTRLMQSWKRRAIGARGIVIAVGVIAVLTAAVFGADPSQAGTTKKRRKATTTIATQQPAESTTLQVTSRVENYIDTSRPTAATAASPKTNQRQLPTLILTPVAPASKPDTKYPLMVFGHGLGGDPASYESLLRAIAQQGYVVAAPTFPLSNKQTPGGPGLTDQPNQAKDMSFVITQLLTDKAVNPDWLFAGGHSLGGITTVDLFARPDTVDKRIDGAIVIAGTVNVFSFNKMFVGTPATPVLFLHGNADKVVPHQLGRSTFLQAKSPKWFVTVVDGDHSFGLASTPNQQVRIGALYVDAITRMMSSLVRGGDVTASLQELVTQHGTVLKLDWRTS